MENPLIRKAAQIEGEEIDINIELEVDKFARLLVTELSANPNKIDKDMAQWKEYVGYFLERFDSIADIDAKLIILISYLVSQNLALSSRRIEVPEFHQQILFDRIRFSLVSIIRICLNNYIKEEAKKKN